MKLKRLLSLVMLCLVGMSGAWAINVGDNVDLSGAEWTYKGGAYSTGYERYSKTSFTAGKILYRTKTGMEPGFYNVEFKAAANLANWDGQTGKGFGIAEIYANQAVYDIEVIEQKSCTLNQSFTLTAYVGNDGVLEFGIKNTKTGGCWYVLDNDASATYLGNTASKANPLDVSNFISNKESSYNSTWTLVQAAYNNSAKERYDGQMLEISDWNANSFNASAKQTIKNLPVGYYKLSAVVQASAGAQVSLQLGSTQTDWKNGNGTSGGDTGKYGWNNISVGAVVSGDVEIGALGKTSAAHNWTNWDHFQLFYYGNGIEHYATELPNSATTKDNWYAYTINVDGDYKITSSANATIKYTQIGSQERNQVTTSVDCVADEPQELSLTAGTIYVSPSVAAIITIEANNNVYNVGEATCDMAYAQPGQTVTVNYAEAMTNDGSASFAKNGNPNVTVNGTAVQNINVTGTSFTFTMPEVAANGTYTLNIPADAFGYAKGNTYNAAQSNITIKTPAIYDGTYYFFNTDPNVQQYMSRGGVWATAGIFDDWGLAIILNTDADGMTTFKFFDNQRYLFEQGFTFGDGTIGRKYRAAKVAGGYTFQNVETTSGKVEYLASWYGRVVNDGVVGANLFGTSNVWAIETPDEHIANYTRNANNQAATAANAAEIDATTLAALETVVDGYTKTIFPVTGAKGEKYQWYAKEQQALAESEYYKEVLNVPAGLYKLTVNAFQRAAWNEWVADANGARGLIYLYANDAKTQLKSVFEYGADAAYTQGNNPNYARDGKNYPNSLQAAYAALETGKFQNVVYVYVPADDGKTTGTLTIGINNPTRQGNKLETGTWCVYDNWQLTLLSDGPVDYVADGVHHYIGAYDNKAVELTNAEPVIDVTLATGSFNVTATNANGLVYTNGATINGGMTNNIVSNGICANLVLTDGGTFKAHKNFVVEDATYTMNSVATTSAGKTFGTLMVPFAVSGVPAGNTTYALTEVAFGEEIHAGAVDAIAANTPVLVTKTGEYSASKVSVAATNDTYTNGQLVGTYKAMDAEASTYVLQNHSGRVAFYIVGDTKPTVNPFRAYIKAQSAGAAPRFININFGDTDGIEAVHSSQSTVQSCYNLAGQRVNAGMGRGIMIINGKKVVK